MHELQKGYCRFTFAIKLSVCVAACASNPSHSATGGDCSKQPLLAQSSAPAPSSKVNSERSGHDAGPSSAHVRLEIAKSIIASSIGPKVDSDYLFAEQFPEIVWTFSGSTEEAPPVQPLRVRWFNPQFVEEQQPSQVGRYLVYAEGKTKDGLLVRRSRTFFCRPVHWKPLEAQHRAFVHFSGDAPFDARALDEHKDAIADAIGQGLNPLLGSSESGAALAAYLHELKPAAKRARPLDDPAIAEVEAQLELRRKILGLAPPIALRPPERLEKPATVIQIGNAKIAGLKPEAVQRIRDAARHWYESTREPFVVALSRSGVVYVHEAYGNVAKDTRFSSASISRFVGGLLIARFIDQGLVQLDDPVGKHLPDWPKTGPKAITIRHCYTHTSGLGVVGDVTTNGPWLDNQLLSALNLIEPAKRFEPGTHGYDLVGKIMETITGRSVARLVYEQIFEPIGGAPSGPRTLGSSLQITALDLARLGQLALNKGSYGNKTLISAVTFGALLPRALYEFYPEIHPTLSVGIGIESVMQADPRERTEGFPKDKLLFGLYTLGTTVDPNALFLVDPDHQVVVAVVGGQVSTANEHYRTEFLQAVDDATH